MLLGSDNWPVEVAPNPDKQISLPVHQIALVVNGVHLLENLKLDELAAKGVYEFAFIMQPLKIQGGTGSTVAPIAVRYSGRVATGGFRHRPCAERSRIASAPRGQNRARPFHGAATRQAFSPTLRALLEFTDGS